MVRLFRESTELLHIETKAVPVEFASSTSIIKRYHGPAQQLFKVLRAALSDITNNKVLQPAVKSINNFIRLNGLVPTFLVYGAFLHLDLATEKTTSTIL